MKIKNRSTRALVSSVVFALSVNQVTANNGAWAVDANGNWSDPANWLAAIVADGAGFTADFTLDQGADTTVTLDTARTIGNLIFGDPDPITTTGSWTLSGANVLTLAGPTPTVTVTAMGTDRTATISSVIAGTAGLTKAGPGTLVLAAANTFTGSVAVSGGALTLSAANPYAGGTAISSGATLNAGNAGAMGSGAVANHGTLNLMVASVTYTGLATSMSGAGTLNVNALGTGSNTVLLNGDFSAFTGTLNVGTGAAAGAGKIQLNGLDHASATLNILPNATVFTAAGTHNAAVVLNGGDTGEALGQLRFQGPTTTWAGPVTLAGDITTTNDAHLGVDAGSIGTISGVIGETGGPRNLIKGGTAAGTLVLTGLNTYTGKTILNNGAINVAVLNNAGTAGNLGQHSTIDIGSGGTGATLVYTGAGETTDRSINLAGTTGGGAITQSGASGLLKLTGGVTATQPGRKTLTLQGGTAASGELSGVISNSSVTGTTLLTTAFASGATTVTLNSVEGVAVGAEISGTGIDVGTTVTFISGNVVTLSTPTIGAGVAGQTMNVTGVINATLLTKAGVGTWTLSGANTFSGVVALNGGTLIAANPNAFGSLPNTVNLSVGGAAAVDLAMDTSIAPYTFSSSSNNPSTFIANRATPGAGITHTTGSVVLGNNVATFAAGAKVTSGTASFTLPSVNLSAGGAGTCTLNPTTATVAITGPTNIGSNSFAKTLNLGGSNVGNRISGDISNGLNAFSLAKSGTSTWTVSGVNSYTGTTTVTGGTLKLDYSIQDSTKLADVAALVLGGGTLEMAGGTHSEIVVSTTLSAGTSSTVTRSSGATGVLHLNTITPAAGAAVRFTQPNIATTDNPNTNGNLGSWAFVTSGGVTDWASNSGGPDGLIVAYTGYSDITRLGPGSAVPNDATKNVRIIEGGSSGHITLAGSPLTEINSLQMTASGGAATIAPATVADVLMVGNEGNGGIFLTSAAGGLTIGTAADDGYLTTGLTANTTPATLNFINDSGNDAVINATITNNGTDVVSLGKIGTGRLVLNGTNTFTGNVGIAGGSVILGNAAALGVPATTSTVSIGSGGLLDLNGNSIGVAALSATTGGTVTDNNATPGISTLGLTNQSGAIAELLRDGANRSLALRVTNLNGTFLLSNGANTFSGGIVLTNGTRMAPGAITAGAYGTGPISVGEAATDKAGIYFATANQTLTNPIIANTGLGTDRVGTFRADATGIVLTGTMTAGTSDFTASTNGTGGVTITGKVTGNNGLKLLSHTLGGTLLTVTLSNAAGSNDYLGNTTINENPQAARSYTLALGASDQIPNGIGKGDLIINTNTTGIGKFNLNGFSETINGLLGTGTVDGVSGTPTLTLGDEDTTATFSGVITDAAGALAVTKIGSGIQTLAGANTYAGATTVNAGTLVLTSTTTSPAFNVPAGSVLEFAPTATVTNTAATTFSGLGTIRKTGVGNLIWGGGAATFAMASGSLIDVQGGIFTGGSSANEIWTNNRSDLNVAAGARFDGVEENIRVDALTGAGIISSGYPHARYQKFTFGVDGGSGTFDGILVDGSTVGNFAKEGTGTQVLTGVNTYTGATTVNSGTLSLAQACLSDTGAVTIAAGAVLNLTHSATDVVGSLTINGTLLPFGIYSNATHPASITGSGKIQAGNLTPFQAWALANGLDGTPGKENGPANDPDGDGDTNLAEFAFDGNPLAGSSKAKTFVLTADSDVDPDTSKELILTVAVRKTAPTFVGSPSPSAAVDGITYAIEGSTTLNGFPTPVTVVPTPITTGLPAVGADYQYRSLSLDGSNGIPAKGFLRAKATMP